MTDPVLWVSDLKQYHYCPRVVYYQYVLPVDRRVTYKMKKGRAAQDEIEVLEARRKLKKYGLSEGRRTFNPWVGSRRLGLSGRLDLLIETDSAYYPVDFKFTRGKPQQNHLFQLGGYALILEDRGDKPVERGFVYLITQKDAAVFDLTPDLKGACLETLENIRRMIREEQFPEAPSRRAKCADCEYRNYCRDIF